MPAPGAPFPPPGPPGGVPRLLRYYEALRFPAEPSGPTSFSFAGPYHAVAPVFVSPSGPTPAWGLEHWRAAAPRPPLRWGRRASQVPGEPLCAYAVFSDPGGIKSPGLKVIRRGPRSGNAEGYPRVRQSRGSIARPGHWLSTLHQDPCGACCKTRFRLRARLYRVGLATHRVPTKGFRDVLVTSLPPFPSFAWRNATLPTL